MKTFETLRIERPEDGVVVMTFNRPGCLNAISRVMIEELHAFLDEMERDAVARVVVITGEGRGFCSGIDLKEGGGAAAESDVPRVVRSYTGQRRIADIIQRMRRIPQPIVAAVNGVAAGGGFSFAMASDIRIAAKSARFIASFINIGLSAGDLGSSYFLPRLVGLSRASDILLTGREVAAEEAERIGLVSRVVEDGEALGASIGCARTMLGKGPFGLRMTKELLNHSLDASSLENVLYMENRTQTLAVSSGDMEEGAAAFREKRAPQFKSR